MKQKSNTCKSSAEIAGWQVSVETVTVCEASKMLAATHHSQRKITRKSVSQYVRDMEAGRFVLTPEPIIITDGGYLIDGQHRLTAVVSSGIPAKFMVVRGVNEEAMPWLNIGRSRTCSDIVKVAGKDISKRDIAIANYIGTLNRMRAYEGITRWERITLAEEYADMIAWIKSYPTINVNGRHVVAAAEAAFAWMSKSSPRASDTVVRGIISGEWAGNTDPIGHLWKYLNGIGYETSRRTKLGKIMVAAKVVQTIMLVEQDKEIRNLRISTGALHSAWCFAGTGPTAKEKCVRQACKLPARGGDCIVHRAIEEMNRAR